MESTLPITRRPGNRGRSRLRNGRITLLAIAAMMLAAIVPGYAQGQLENYYQFTTSPGTFTPITGTTVIFSSNGGGVGAYNESATAGPYSIGFNFVFNGLTYTTFTVNARGFMVLGSTLSSEPNNAIEAPPITDPILAAYWDQQHMYDGSATCSPIVNTHVSYALTGISPNRVLTVEWGTQLVSSATYYYGGNCLPMCNYQIRLYECTNRIEMQYGAFRISTNTAVHGTASVGLAYGPNNYLSVTPDGSPTASGVSANNRVDNNNNLSTSLIPEGTIYAFSHATPDIVGRTGANNGGTATMANGDTLFRNFSTLIGSPAVYTPFNLSVPAGGCSNRRYSLQITGTNASDYYFNTPGTQMVSGSINNGTTITPAITFMPTGSGVRTAKLIYTDSSNMVSRTYTLMATGLSRVVYTGIIPQGGTTQMKSGDTLLKGMYVVRNTSQSFTPFTLTNSSTNASVPPVAVTYTITDPTNQYTINPTTASLANGQSSTPTLTFNATGIGAQPATLTINADGEVRTYTLYAVSAVPSAIFRIDGQVIDSSTTLFTKEGTCVGEQGYTYAIDVENIGGVPFVIQGLDLYATDTVYGQGVPRYPLLHDGVGNLIPSSEYFISMAPPTFPLTSAQRASYPMVIPFNPPFTRIYLTFVGERPGKRFVRAYLRTNGQNLGAANTDGVMTTGLLRVDLYGRSTGSQLSDNANGGLPKTVNFAAAHIGDSVDNNVTLFNPGTCTLRVSLKSMDILAGDVDEFKIVQKPSSLVDPATSDLLLPPGASDAITIRFKPRQVGSRRAGLRLMTNDSTIMIPGLTERGVYYIDLYGNGRADVYADNADFGTVLIGATGADLSHQIVRLKNTLNGPIVITKIFFDGVDTSEFTRDGGTAWPKIPIVLNGGQEINLGVVFGPQAGGQPGPRGAMLKMITINGDTITSYLTGVAGTRTLQLNPTLLNFGTVSAGKVLRKMITLTNTGTMPVTLGAPQMSPGSDFSFAPLARTVLAPGQTENIELTYAPQLSGGSNATLTFPSNATGGSLQLTLSGSATKTRFDVNDPSSAIAGRGDGQAQFGAAEDLSVSGVQGEDFAGGMRLWQSVPNPARDQVEIRYSLAKPAAVSLELYDATGRLVRVLDAGNRGLGEIRLVVNVSDLASGTYHYRLSAGGMTLSRTMTIAK